MTQTIAYSGRFWAICMGDVIDTIIERETEKARIEIYIDLVRENALNIEIAAVKTGMTVEEFKELMDKNQLKTV